MIDVDAITGLHEATVHRWHESGIDNPYDGFLLIVCRQHQQNYRLWHEEDIARSLDVSDGELAQVKRNIDRLNQQRNDLIELLDQCIIEQLAGTGVDPWPGTPSNTETPGSVIDRLSILALRIFHMEEQTERDDATPTHRGKARAKLEILREQRRDLSDSLAELFEDLFNGRKFLKVYRQFKMYNDPTMNPYLYGAKRKVAA